MDNQSRYLIFYAKSPLGYTKVIGDEAKNNIVKTLIDAGYCVSDTKINEG